MEKGRKLITECANHIRFSEEFAKLKRKHGYNEYIKIENGLEELKFTQTVLDKVQRAIAKGPLA